METAINKWNEIVYIIGYNDVIKPMTYGEYCREYGGDETTSPRGIESRLHIRDKSEHSEAEETQINLFEIWTWGTGGNNPRFTGESFDSEDEANNYIMECFEYHATNKNDTAPQYYVTIDEALRQQAQQKRFALIGLIMTANAKRYGQYALHCFDEMCDRLLDEDIVVLGYMLQAHVSRLVQCEAGNAPVRETV